MKDTGYEDAVLDSIEQVVSMVKKTGKRIVDSIVESDPVGKMEKWLNEEIPDAIRVIEANGGWAKFFSLMWHVQEKCGDELKMEDVRHTVVCRTLEAPVGLPFNTLSLQRVRRKPLGQVMGARQSSQDGGEGCDAGAAPGSCPRRPQCVQIALLCGLPQCNRRDGRRQCALLPLQQDRRWLISRFWRRGHDSIQLVFYYKG